MSHKNNNSNLRLKAQEVLQKETINSNENLNTIQILHELRVHQIELEMQNEELRRTQQELAISRKRYMEFFDFAPVGYCILDEAGFIAETNFTALTLFGLERNALIKKTFTSFIFREDQDIYYFFKKNLEKNINLHACELRMVKSDGSSFWARLEGVATKDSEGMPTIRVVISDVSKREEQLLLTNRELQEAHNQLEAFYYSISHDLKSPINTIMSFNKIILDEHQEDLGSAVKDLFAHITSATKRLDLVLEGLTELSRISGSKLVKESFNLSSLVANLALELHKLDPNRQINFIIPQNIMVIGDSRLMTVIISNLLNNAYKFTSKKSLAIIEFGLMKKNDQVIYFIRDNGAGFDMRHQEKLFKPFERLHNNTEFPGTGIGLASVQRAIHRQEGKIWAEAEPSKGAVFYFVFSKET